MEKLQAVWLKVRWILLGVTVAGSLWRFLSDDPDLFSFPFVYLTGALDFTPFAAEEIATLQRFLNRKLG